MVFMSGRQDSNLRPPGPKPGAMTGLRYAPNVLFRDCEISNYFLSGIMFWQKDRESFLNNLL